MYDRYVGIDTLSSVLDGTVYLYMVICASQVSFVDVSMLTVVVVRGEWGLFIVSLGLGEGCPLPSCCHSVWDF